MAKKWEQGEIPFIKTQLNYHSVEQKHETTSLPSTTVPNQSMSIQEIVKRYRAGMPVDVPAGTPLYTGDGEPLANMDHLDLVDRQAYIDSVADTLVSLKQKIEAEAKTAKEKEFVKKVEEEVQRKLAELRSKNSITDIEPSEE